MNSWLKKIYRSKSDLTKEEMKEMICNNDNVVLLDVRSKQEYNEGHLMGAINIPIYELYEKAPKLIKDKDIIIIAYCTIGIRSKNALKILKQMGYKNLFHLEGGIE